MPDPVTAGAVSRKMIAEDARWIVDAFMAPRQSAPEASGLVPLLLLGHSARIAYEGSIAIRSENPHLGKPELSNLLTEQHADVITRSRHATKLLDDTKKSIEDLQLEMRSYYEQHHQHFTGNSVQWARFLEKDLGLYGLGGRVVGASIPLQFRMGILAVSKLEGLGEQMHEVAQVHGRVHKLLSQASDDTSPISLDSDYSSISRITSSDHLADRYLSGRYASILPIEAKLLLLMIECELNMTAMILPFTEARHPDAVFRARTISLFHALSGVGQILERYELPSQSAAARQLSDYIGEPRVQRFVNKGGARDVRNRCMHYEIRKKALSLDVNLPMNGIVESIYPETSFSAFNKEVVSITTELSGFLRNWGSK